MKYTKEETERSLRWLEKCLKPGTVVYSVLRKVSQSGMSRQIDFYVIKKNEPLWLSNSIATVLEYPTADNGAIKIGGCGMDMGFKVVYDLGQRIWPNGTRKPHGTRNGQPDSCGGYALKSRWI